jgi:uncharacterized protein YdeI (YjbR/CyaY-like superfamily)
MGLPTQGRAIDMETQFMTFENAAQWESWLAENHGQAADVWIRIAKKNAPTVSVTLAEALDAALCYGWIDSHRKGYDKDHYLQRYSPRRSKSAWSQVNVDKVEVLIAAGRMKPAGFAAIQAAKEDGRWDAAYERQRTATIPQDLADALATNKTARIRYEQLGRTRQYALFLRLMKARTPGSRAVQLQQIIAAL